MNFTVFNPDGKILRTGTCPDSMVNDQAGAGEFVIPEKSSIGVDYVVSGEVVLLPVKPSPSHIFNYTTKQWEDPRTLQDHKDAKWSNIKQARSSAEYVGFTWGGSTFDSNAISQQRISNAVQLAVLDPAFSITWTLADNTARVLSGADMLAVGRALGDHVATQHAKAQALRGQIEAASTAGEVEAVRW